MPASSDPLTQPGLPGHTLLLNYMPQFNLTTNRQTFPYILRNEHEYSSSGSALVYRELVMMRAMNAITDKPEWERKVFDDIITSKWTQEILQSGEDITPTMIEYIIKELQWKADLSLKDQMVTAFEPGVVKSDTAIPGDLQQALKDAVAPLENVPEDQKDYHPGSDQKVVDLVHPSLFPLVYGRTHILPDQTIGLDNCIGSMGQGEPLPVPAEEHTRITYSIGPSPWSRKFQWLPCNVGFTGESSGDCQINSYINNVHPVQHRALYEAVEKIIARTIPLWNRSLTECSVDRVRIPYEEVEYAQHPEPEPEVDHESGETCDDDSFIERMEAWEARCPIIKPEPGEFTVPEVDPNEEVNLREQFGNSGLQVIVKLANIELSPEKPEYAGGSWHIEGQFNERICASAIYYYDSNNITPSTLSFRQRADEGTIREIGYEQSKHEFLQEIFGFGPDVVGFGESCVTQDLGDILCREGRVVTFPNVLQHRVSPFGLADKTKPGHRKILALFLVDPHLRIISSANVPPQREDWGAEKRELVRRLLGDRLPAELGDIVTREGIWKPLMSMDEALKLRLELMEERSVKGREQDHEFRTGDFCLCEH